MSKTPAYFQPLFASAVQPRCAEKQGTYTKPNLVSAELMCQQGSFLKENIFLVTSFHLNDFGALISTRTGDALRQTWIPQDVFATKIPNALGPHLLLPWQFSCTNYSCASKLRSAVCLQLPWSIDLPNIRALKQRKINEMQSAALECHAENLSAAENKLWYAIQHRNKHNQVRTAFACFFPWVP